MIDYFLSFGDRVKEIHSLCRNLNQIKTSLAKGEIDNPLPNDVETARSFEAVLEYAISVGNEKLANGVFVFKTYYRLFLLLIEYRTLLAQREYEKSWSSLQDCLDAIRLIHKHNNQGNSYEVDDLELILDVYEGLYPYRYFLSPGYVIGKASCSICGQSALGLNCNHIKGELYWGKLATVIIEELMLKEVSIVEYPDDKRKIIHIKNQDYSYRQLEKFLDLDVPFLRLITIMESKEYDADGEVVSIRYNISPQNKRIKIYYFLEKEPVK